MDISKVSAERMAAIHVRDVVGVMQEAVARECCAAAINGSEPHAVRVSEYHQQQAYLLDEQAMDMWESVIDELIDVLPTHTLRSYGELEYAGS